ncbi:MAG: hypothetical protein AB8B63_21055 [Granulosicoccus sp.]
MPLAPGTARLRLIGLIFICIVIAVVAYTQQLIIPIFLGLLAWGKALLKQVTPKLALLLLKNSVVIQVRRLAIQASAHLLVKSHKPWRRWLTDIRHGMIDTAGNLFKRYLALPLWIRTAIALGVLLTTAGSSLAIFALLIIPQPLLNWLRQQFMSTMNKLGVSRFSATIWNVVVPARYRMKWHMYVKWTLGRRQVAMARKLHTKVVPEQSKRNTQ